MLLLARDTSAASIWYWEYMTGSEACKNEDSASDIRPALLLDVVDASCLQLHVALHSRCHITVLIP